MNHWQLTWHFLTDSFQSFYLQVCYDLDGARIKKESIWKFRVKNNESVNTLKSLDDAREWYVFIFSMCVCIQLMVFEKGFLPLEFFSGLKLQTILRLSELHKHKNTRAHNKTWLQMIHQGNQQEGTSFLWPGLFNGLWWMNLPFSHFCAHLFSWRKAFCVSVPSYDRYHCVSIQY